MSDVDTLWAVYSSHVSVTRREGQQIKLQKQVSKSLGTQENYIISKWGLNVVFSFIRDSIIDNKEKIYLVLFRLLVAPLLYFLING